MNRQNKLVLALFLIFMSVLYFTTRENFNNYSTLKEVSEKQDCRYYTMFGDPSYLRFHTQFHY